jgi:hypothetical protein
MLVDLRPQRQPDVRAIIRRERCSVGLLKRCHWFPLINLRLLERLEREAACFSTYPLLSVCCWCLLRGRRMCSTAKAGTLDSARVRVREHGRGSTANQKLLLAALPPVSNQIKGTRIELPTVLPRSTSSFPPRSSSPVGHSLGSHPIITGILQWHFEKPFRAAPNLHAIALA